jgi:hypothetical protein
MKEQHELYEYARRRIKQKKGLYFHFVLLFLVSLFLFVSTTLFNLGLDSNWDIYLITIWFFVFLLHFIKVYITDRFMNKNWEREQIERLIGLQKNKLSEIESQITEDKSTQEIEI